MTNKIKGDMYENFVLHKLEGSEAWLWKNIPEKILIDCGFFEDQYEYLKIKEKSKSKNINFLMDTGIDIIERIDNKFIAIQCKNGYKDGLTINDLGSFYFMLYNYPSISNAKIYYTNKINHLVKKLSKNTNLEFIKLEMNDSAIITPINEYKLYDYQLDAVKSIDDHYKKSNRGILSIVCGGGKTLVASTCAIKYNQIIFISPLRQFAEQNLERFQSYYSDYKYLLVDTDGTRDEEEIINFIKNNKKTFISVTYKSIDILVKASNNFTDLFTDCFVVFDEFHNISVNNLINSLDPINKLLNSKQKILFLSATPRVYDLETNNNFDDFSNLLGDIIYNLSINEAINKKIICNYNIYIPSIGLFDENIKIISEINNKIDISDLDNDYLAKSIYLYKCITFHGSRKTIVYCKDSTDLKNLMVTCNFLKEYYELNDIFIDKITYKTQRNKRNEIIKSFSESNDYALLFSIEILDECIDIPSCDSIFISYNSSSKIRTIQRINRATRNDKNNPFKIANIFLWCNTTDNILETLTSLKEYDVELSTKVFIQDLQLKKLTEKQDKIKLLDESNINKYIIGVKEYRFISWITKFNQLKEYIDTNGCRPTRNDSNLEIKSLGIWTNCQNMNHKNKKEIMKNIEVYDNWTKFISDYKSYFLENDERWDINYTKVIDYIKENDKLPSTTDKSTEIKSLGSWITLQKRHFRNNELNDDQNGKWVKFIDEFGEYLISNEEFWYLMFNKCKDFIIKNNRRPSKVKEEEKKLNHWINGQIQFYKLKIKNMKNKEIYNQWHNFVTSNENKKYFNCDYNKDWYIKFNELVSYYKEHKTYPHYSSSLGAWYKKQVYKYNNIVNIMTVEEIFNVWSNFIENPLEQELIEIDTD